MINIPTLIAGYLAANEDKKYYKDVSAVLKRIAADRRAHAAIYVIAKKDADRHQIWKILALCIDAEHQLRTFQSLIADERNNAKQLQRHRQSVADLRQFIDQAARPPNPPVDWLPISYREHSTEYHKKALDYIAELIELRQQASDEVMIEVGVTRKSGTNTAAATATIGWLAEGIEHLVGKPCVPQVATLAEIALGVGEVTSDRVRAARKRRI
jgi:hypothetical protein